MHSGGEIRWAFRPTPSPEPIRTRDEADGLEGFFLDAEAAIERVEAAYLSTRPIVP